MVGRIHNRLSGKRRQSSSLRIGSLKDVNSSLPQSGEMLIVTRLPVTVSVKSGRVRRPCIFYKHYVPTARFCTDSLERLLLRQSPSLCNALCLGGEIIRKKGRTTETPRSPKDTKQMK